MVAHRIETTGFSSIIIQTGCMQYGIITQIIMQEVITINGQSVIVIADLR